MVAFRWGLGPARHADFANTGQGVQEDDPAKIIAECQPVGLLDRRLIAAPDQANQARAVEPARGFKLRRVFGQVVGHSGATGRDMKWLGGRVRTVVTAE